jgi:hypothetical protein
MDGYLSKPFAARDLIETVEAFGFRGEGEAAEKEPPGLPRETDG